MFKSKKGRLALTAASLTLAAAAAGLITGPAAAIGDTPPKTESATHRLSLEDALEEARGAIYLVGVLDDDGGFRQIGTGFAVRSDANRGLIATNAHVADEVNKYIQKQLRVVIRRSGTEGPTDLPLTGVPVIHPGYSRWSTLSDRGLTARRAGGYAEVEVVTPADVALLPTTGGLSSVLTIARQERLSNLRSGAEVIYLGFPAENIAGQTGNVPATAGFGHIQSMTGFMFGPASAALSLVINHDVQLTGGSSGGPLLVADPVTGRLSVIGAHNAGSHVFVDSKRIPVAKGYAQRADYIRELLDGTADAAQNDRDDLWAKEVRALTLTPEERFGVFQAAAEKHEKQLKRESRFSIDLPRGSSGMVVTRPIEVRAGEVYVIIGTGLNWDDIDLRITHSGEVLGTDTKPDGFAVVRWEATFTGTVNLTISAPTVYGSSASEVLVATVHDR